MKFISITAAAILASSAESRLEGGNDDNKRDLVSEEIAKDWNEALGGNEMHTDEFSKTELNAMTKHDILRTEQGNTEMKKEDVLVEGADGYRGGSKERLPPQEKVDELIQLEKTTEELKKQAEAAKEKMEEEVQGIVETYVDTSGKEGEG